jgi:hypothetical protein
MPIIDAVKEILRGFPSGFDKNELAYLALTSKVELPIRDKLAWRLAHQYEHDFYVAREWNRIDMAVLRSNDAHPLMLCQLKAMYTFDAVIGGPDSNGFAETCADELDKLKMMRGLHNSIEICTILLATHPLCKLPSHSETSGAIKYSQGVNRAFRECGSENVIKTNCHDAVSAYFTERGYDSLPGEIKAGQFYGIGVEILYWVVTNKQSGCEVS